MRTAGLLGLLPCGTLCLLLASSPLLASDYPPCTERPSDEDVEAARGAHAAAKRSFEQGQYERAIELWTTAYDFDCTAHLVLVNIGRAYEKLHEEDKALEVYRTYVERAGPEADPEIVAKVKAADEGDGEEQEPTDDEERPHRELVAPSWLGEVGGDVYWWGATRLDAIFPIIPRVRINPADRWFLDARLPFALWAVDRQHPSRMATGSASTFRFGLGNPTLGVGYYVLREQVRWSVGGSLGVPAGAIDDFDLQVTNIQASNAMASYDAFLWVPNAVPVALATQLDWQALDFMILTAGFGPMVFVPLRKARGAGTGAFLTGDVELDLQFLFGIDLRHESGWGGGARFTTVWFPTVDGDQAQLALEPYGGYDGGAWLAQLGLLVALDGPLGFGFDEEKVATLHGSFTWRFE